MNCYIGYEAQILGLILQFLFFFFSYHFFAMQLKFNKFLIWNRKQLKCSQKWSIICYHSLHFSWDLSNYIYEIKSEISLFDFEKQKRCEQPDLLSINSFNDDNVIA